MARAVRHRGVLITPSLLGVGLIVALGLGHPLIALWLGSGALVCAFVAGAAIVSGN